ncbi:hypothetical protein Salat_0722900 [Sesamum alatum]|uniref:Uncharacterized protein n=1 Tax=Sesamum alatum TaxID=300844 RepID=A0AAE1YSS1_9LAMI|nr:hypothetical protein Salat_0722900 [Sesamum alatum]
MRGNVRLIHTSVISLFHTFWRRVNGIQVERFEDEKDCDGAVSTAENVIGTSDNGLGSCGGGTVMVEIEVEYVGDGEEDIFIGSEWGRGDKIGGREASLYHGTAGLSVSSLGAKGRMGEDLGSHQSRKYEARNRRRGLVMLRPTRIRRDEPQNCPPLSSSTSLNIPSWFPMETAMLRDIRPRDRPCICTEKST